MESLQPLTGRVRRPVRYGDIVLVTDMLSHQLGVGRLSDGIRVQVRNHIEGIVFAPFPHGYQEDTLSCAVMSHCTCEEVPAVFTR